MLTIFGHTYAKCLQFEKFSDHTQVITSFIQEYVNVNNILICMMNCYVVEKCKSISYNNYFGGKCLLYDVKANELLIFKNQNWTIYSVEGKE